MVSQLTLLDRELCNEMTSALDRELRESIGVTQFVLGRDVEHEDMLSMSLDDTDAAEDDVAGVGEKLEAGVTKCFFCRISCGF